MVNLIERESFVAAIVRLVCNGFFGGNDMDRITLSGMAFTAAAGLLATAPTSAATTTLDFAGNICGVAGNQACGNGSQIGQNYGDGIGVDVSYRGFNANTGITTEAYLKHWGPGYGDLQNVAWTGSDSSNFTAEIVFSAQPGYELTILGFDAGCYLNRVSCRSFPFTINRLGGGLATNGTATPAANSHDSFTFNLGYSSNGYVLQWGPDAFDGGLTNIAFDVRAIRVGVVPEPSSWALLILGFALIGGTMRTRATARLAAA